jgi:NAD(P)-dependent dehydrogenase (short-subunit alcohol dehydrogenase family)
MPSLAGKTAIVTGAGSGIGRATARLLAEQGAKVVVADWNAETGEATAAWIRGGGFEARFRHTNVSLAAEVERMVGFAVEWGGRLDILINNAAVQILATLTGTSEEDWERIHSVNLKGVFLCSKYAIPEMIRAGGGSVVNMASVLGLVGDPELAAYCAAKGGVIALTKAAAMGYGPHGVRVNCICPGDVDTPMVQEYFDKDPDPRQARQRVSANYALRRIASPREVAETALWLASDASSFVTGSVETLEHYRDGLDDDAERLHRFLMGVLEQGVYALPDGRFYTSAVHSDADIQHTLQGVDGVLRAW